MPSHRILAFISSVTLVGIAGCEADPGTVGPGQYYTSNGAGGAGSGLGGASGIGGAGGAGGGGETSCECGPGLECCQRTCVDLLTDVLNCGACGTVCPGPQPFCDAGSCVQWPCDPDYGCEEGVCCGHECCDGTQVCCNVTDVSGAVAPHCVASTNSTCPLN